MSERKMQIWFRPDQAELTVECLQFVANRCAESTSLTSPAEAMSKRFVKRRIAEIVALFGQEAKEPA